MTQILNEPQSGARVKGKNQRGVRNHKFSLGNNQATVEDSISRTEGSFDRETEENVQYDQQDDDLQGTGNMVARYQSPRKEQPETQVVQTGAAAQAAYDRRTAKRNKKKVGLKHNRSPRNDPPPSVVNLNQ